MLTLEFDGLFRGAPRELQLGDDAGVMCYGWVILRDGVEIARGHGGYARARGASSNVAEYLGLIEGLEALSDLLAQRETVLVCGDAQSIIKQMEGKASVTSSSIKPVNRRARALAREFKHLHWSWTERRNNAAADALTRRALRQIRAHPEHYQDVFLRGGRGSGRLHPILDLRMYQAA